MKPLTVLVAGSGKLAREILAAYPRDGSTEVIPWSDAQRPDTPSIVVHAGSGRQLGEVMAYCRATGSPLVELATGSAAETGDPGFPIVVCPNTNVLMLKVMAMLAASGSQFRNCSIRVTESHQAAKSSVPGTAVAMAQSLGVPEAAIVSVRDPEVQTGTLKIPAGSLARHAFHRIEIEDPTGSVMLETRVFGDAPYAQGLAQIVAAIRAHALEPRCYSVLEFIDNGWL